MERWIGEKVDVQKHWEQFNAVKRKKSEELAFAVLVDEQDEILLVASLFA